MSEQIRTDFQAPKTTLQKLRDEFLNSAETKIDKCPECGFHSMVKLEDAWDACLSALQAQAVEFDERSMIETATDMAQEFIDGLDGPCLGDYKAFALECYRRQFEQTKAQVVALKVEIERLYADRDEWNTHNIGDVLLENIELKKLAEVHIVHSLVNTMNKSASYPPNWKRRRRILIGAIGAAQTTRLIDMQKLD